MNYIDLFAGAGGLSEGFTSIGFNPVAHVEMNREACETLKTRAVYYYLKDNGKLDEYKKYLLGELSKEELYSTVPEVVLKSVIHQTMSEENMPVLFDLIDDLKKEQHVEQIDLIVGGPPCQAYSLVGRAVKSDNMVGDPRNYLYRLYIEVLKKYTPTMFVFENVPGLLTANGGQYFEDMKNAFKDAGYTIDHSKAITVENEAERDGYWTNVGYFNSIRELGQTETWIKADIDEYLHVIYKRRYEDKEEGYSEKRRYIYEDEELTSRISSDKIPFILQKLGYEYPVIAKDKRPVDICLATNMISVGVDIPRLGLMTVSGQPKTTSEYIQATSRVGRNSKAPGLVFTIYNPGKPRDRSHYEHFETYHSRIYCNVEPTSVTPFSAQLRERALHAIIFGLLRLKGDSDLNADPPKLPRFDDVDEIKEIITARIKAIDVDELEKTLDHIDSIIAKWEIQEPGKYQDFAAGEVLPLMFPAGSMRNANWGDRGFPTPTSMRSVDASCEAMVLEGGYFEEDE